MLAISFSGIFSGIGTAFKSLNSEKFASIINNVVLPIAGVAVSIKNASKSQKLPGAPPVQPSSQAPDTAAAAGGNGGGNSAAQSTPGARNAGPWYANPLVYIGGAVVVLFGAILLARRN